MRGCAVARDAVGADAFDPFAIGPSALAWGAREDVGGNGADAFGGVADSRNRIRVVGGQELIEHGLRKLLRAGGKRQRRAEQREQQQASGENLP